MNLKSYSGIVSNALFLKEKVLIKVNLGNPRIQKLRSLIVVDHLSITNENIINSQKNYVSSDIHISVILNEKVRF